MFQDMPDFAEAESRFLRSVDQYREMMQLASPEEKLALVDQFMRNLQQHLQECERSMDDVIVNQMQNDNIINQLLELSFSSDEDEDDEDYESEDDDIDVEDTDEEDTDVEDYDDSNEPSDGYESSVSR